MLLETTKTTKTLVEVSLPYFTKRTASDLPDTWYYISGRRDLMTITNYPASKKWEIEVTAYMKEENSLSAMFTKEAVKHEPIRPSEFWAVLDKALASLQETVYIDRGNLFK